VIRREEPDVLLVNFVWTLPAVWLARFPKRIPMHVDTQNVETERFRSAGTRWWRAVALFERVSAGLADRVFAVSDHDLAMFGELGVSRGKIRVIPNGYDGDTFYPDAEAGTAMRAALGIGDNEALLLYFGHMGYEPNRDALRLLQRAVLPKLDRLQASYRLVVAGRGSDALGHEFAHPRATFTGVLERIQDAINAADVVAVSLTRGGGTRTKILESIACGTPVVSTTAGAEGIDRDVCGNLLSVEDDWDAFACALMRAAQRQDDPSPLLEFKERYSWAALAKQLESALA
jgi:glycosyltransferase involved in cell wall biosynthesis